MEKWDRVGLAGKGFCSQRIVLYRHGRSGSIRPHSRWRNNLVDERGGNSQQKREPGQMVFHSFRPADRVFYSCLCGGNLGALGQAH